RKQFRDLVQEAKRTLRSLWRHVVRDLDVVPVTEIPDLEPGTKVIQRRIANDFVVLAFPVAQRPEVIASDPPPQTEHGRPLKHGVHELLRRPPERPRAREVRIRTERAPDPNHDDGNLQLAD